VRKKLLPALVALAAAFLSAAWFFRDSIASGCNVIPGDLWDGRLLLGLHEHWRLVFAGERPWNTIAMFWPVEGTLGYSDTFFFQGTVFSALRVLGMDLWHAFLATYFLMAVAGFLAMYWFLRRCAKVTRLPALAAAALFVNFSPVAVGYENSHLQLTAVWLLPAVAGLCWLALSEERHALARAAAAGLFLSLLLFSTFYVVWFFVFFSGVTFLVWLAASSLREGREPLCFIARRWRTFAAFGAGFAVFLIPFLATYLPVLRSLGPRDYSQTWKGIPWVSDLVNTGSNGWLWGWMERWMVPVQRVAANELRFGLPPFTFLLFVAALVWLLFLWRRRALAGTAEKAALVAGVTVVLCWISLVKIFGFSGWQAINALVPGAGAIRCPFRMNIVLSFAVLFTLCVAAARVLRGRHRITAAILVTLVACVLFAEQVRLRDPYGRIRRDAEIARMSGIEKPPADARVFYVKNPPCDATHACMDGFLAAEQYGLNLLNGHTGLSPKDWPMDDILAKDYEQRVMQWLGWEKPQGLYALDLSTGKWTASVFDSAQQSYETGHDIVKEGTLPFFSRGGWHGMEEWGVWTDRKARLDLRLVNIPETPLVLHMRLHAYLDGTLQAQTVLILLNGKELARLSFDSALNERTVTLPLPVDAARDGILRLEFLCPEADSPRNTTTTNRDGRVLGVGVDCLLLRPAP
jgi:hypothetical protein